jgi:hypothetical protein
MGDVDWLQRVLDSRPIQPPDGIERFSSTPPSSAARDGSTALDLVRQAAEVMKGLKDRTVEIEKHARRIYEIANEKLQLAEKRIQELEAENQAAKGLISEGRVKIIEADEALKLERSRVETAEKQICEIEMGARIAEARARESMDAIVRIEDAIRTQILVRYKLGGPVLR